MKKKKSNHKMPNRNQLIKLLKEYNELYSVKNKLKRICKNPFTFRLILIIIPMIQACVIAIVFKIFFSDYINLLKTLGLIAILTTLTIVFAILTSKELEEYYPKKIKIRDDEILKLLKRNQINEKNIKDIIDYFLQEIEYEKLEDNGSPIINTVSEFWNELFFVILGVVISQFNQEEFKQEEITLMIGILATGVLILTVKVLNYFDRKSSYFFRKQKLVLDLKQINLLYYHK